MNKGKSNIGFVCISSVITFLIVLVGLRLSYVYILWILLGIGIAFFYENKYAYILLFATIPYTAVMKLSTSSVSFFTYYLLAVAFIVVLKNTQLNRRFLMGIIVFILVTFYDVGNALTDWIKMIAGFLLVNDFCRQYENEDGPIYCVAFANGLIGASIIGLQKSSNYLVGRFFNDFNTEYINGQNINRFSALYQDPNYFSVSIVIAVFILLAFVINKRLDKRIGIVLSLVLLYFGSLSYSKMFFIAISVSLLILLFIKVRKSKYFFVSLFLGIVALAVIIKYLGNTSFYIGMVSRFDKGGIDNGRISLIKSYLGVIFNSFKISTIGAGIGAGFVGTHGSHNTYIELIYNFGVVGSCIYIFTLISAIKPYSKVRKVGVESKILIIVFMFMIGTLGMLKMNDMIFYYMLIFALTNTLYDDLISTPMNMEGIYDGNEVGKDEG